MPEFIPQEFYVRERIREVFPNAPERCLNCPSLFNAASILLSTEALSTSIAMHPENADNPLAEPETAESERSKEIANISGFVTGVHEEHIRNVTEYAEGLWGNCSGHAVISEEIEKRNKIIRTLACASSAAYARFVSPLRVSVGPKD